MTSRLSAVAHRRRRIGAVAGALAVTTAVAALGSPVMASTVPPADTSGAAAHRST